MSDDWQIETSDRAQKFGAFLDGLFTPTPAQLWLQQAAEKLRQQREDETRSEAL
jgi:hypothetical protein